MLTRLYVDNFRSLVNFELKFDRLNVLMGANGSGKSTVFEVLRRLQGFIAGDLKTDELFSKKDLTRWQTLLEQRFELNLSIDGAPYEYVLVIEHFEKSSVRVKEERLHMAGEMIFSQVGNEFEANTNENELVRFDFNKGPIRDSSSVPVTSAFVGNTWAQRFSDVVSRIVIASVSPQHMESLSRNEASQLLPQMENFISWYRRTSQLNMGGMFELVGELKKVMLGFSSFSLRDSGEDTKSLKVLFDSANKKGVIAYDFSELSDGQRVLIALYALIHGMKGEGLTLFLDEPDNFVALREIQPWLATLEEEVGEGIEQAVLISHHPRIINFLGNSNGRWFSREGAGHTRLSDEAPASIDGLSLSETIARGWEE